MLHVYKSHDRSLKFVEGEAFLVKMTFLTPVTPT